MKQWLKLSKDPFCCRLVQIILFISGNKHISPSSRRVDLLFSKALLIFSTRLCKNNQKPWEMLLFFGGKKSWWRCFQRNSRSLYRNFITVIYSERRSIPYAPTYFLKCYIRYWMDLPIYRKRFLDDILL